LRRSRLSELPVLPLSEVMPGREGVFEPAGREVRHDDSAISRCNRDVVLPLARRPRDAGDVGRPADCRERVCMACAGR